MTPKTLRSNNTNLILNTRDTFIILSHQFSYLKAALVFDFKTFFPTFMAVKNFV